MAGHTKNRRSKTATRIHDRQKRDQDSTLGSPGAVRGRKHRWTWLATSLVVVAITAAVAMRMFFGAEVRPAPGASSSAAIAALLPSQAGAQLLRGRWVRPDGGYVIELGNAQPDGRLEAAYFNPRPVNVSRAEWHRGDDGLHVFVELQQANYPGATYKLRYLPATDQLAGDYFQPLYQQTFRVHFLRKSP